MKKIVSLLLIVAASLVSLSSNGQRGYSTLIKNTTIAAGDTVTVTNMEGGVVVFEYNVTEVSGTTAGKIYLEGKFLSSWVKLDSVSLSDVTTIQTLRYFPTKTYYRDYRLICTNTSSAVLTILA